MASTPFPRFLTSWLSHGLKQNKEAFFRTGLRDVGTDNKRDNEENCPHFDMKDYLTGNRVPP